MSGTWDDKTMNSKCDDDIVVTTCHIFDFDWVEYIGFGFALGFPNGFIF